MLDTKALLHSTIQTPSSTKKLLIPSGQEYLMTCTDANINAYPVKEGPNAGSDFVVYTTTWEISDESGVLEAVTKRRKFLVDKKVTLELDENGHLLAEEGTNVQLGRFREALGMNDSEFSFTAPIGRQMMGTVTHQKNKQTDEYEYENVGTLRPLDA